MAVDEGIEGQSIIPATGEVNHVDLRTKIMDIRGPPCKCTATPDTLLSPCNGFHFNSDISDEVHFFLSKFELLFHKVGFQPLEMGSAGNPKHQTSGNCAAAS